MSNLLATSIGSGPTGRSHTQLQTIISDLALKDVNLGKHTAPTHTAVKVEFESLAFELPPESALMRSIRNGIKTGNETVPLGHRPNCNKIGYKNAGLWSARSINLEQLIKPLLHISVATWPDYETINGLVSATDFSSEGSLQYAMLDTLLVRINEAHEVRYGFDRLYSYWSHGSDQFEVRKVRFQYVR